jgi:putative phosphoesterase
MLIGIISDTHDDMEAIKKIVEVFNEKNILHVIHAGDIVSPFTFEILGGLKAEFTGIFGNNDGDRLLLNEKSNGRVFPQPLILTFGNLKACVVHELDAADSLAKSGDFGLVVYGHTHTPDIRKTGGTLIINPGKAARLHKGKSTYAILDTDRMESEVIQLLS